jgi:hypothetical protein
LKYSCYLPTGSCEQMEGGGFFIAVFQYLQAHQVDLAGDGLKPEVVEDAPASPKPAPPRWRIAMPAHRPRAAPSPRKAGPIGSSGINRKMQNTKCKM